MNNESKPASVQSLAAKLAILYSITSFSVLLIASGLLYWSLLNHLQKEHQHLLTAKIVEIRKYLNSSSLFGETLHDLIDVEHHHSQVPHTSAIHPGIPHHVFVWIFDEQGDLLVESNVMQAFPKPLNFPQIDNNDLKNITIKTESKENQRYLLASTWVATTDNGQERQLLVQALLELAADETLRSDFQHTLVSVLIFGVLASAFAGFAVTRRGLRPLRQITKSIHTINAHQLDERVDSAKWPKEIALLAKAFDEMLGRLDQSFARLSQFSADLAHELRTPVNNLMGEAEVALSRNRSAEEYRQILESNIEECRHIARMIDELLFLARAENPKTEINCTDFSVEDQFKAIQEFYDFLAEEKHITISYQANRVRLYAEPNLFRRILSNLVSNALRYTACHGVINLSAHQFEDKTVKITIEDNGAGIDPESLPHIFDRFFRADQSRHRDNHGSGLGLAIVKSIMEMHGGEIKADSQLQQGTTISLFFPNTP